MKLFLNFNYAEIFFISFCSFWSFGVYGPSSFMVDDYTAERALAVIAINVIKAGI